MDGYSQVVIGVHQAGAWGDDAVAIVVGIVAEGDVEAIFQANETGHGIG